MLSHLRPACAVSPSLGCSALDAAPKKQIARAVHALPEGPRYEPTLTS